MTRRSSRGAVSSTAVALAALTLAVSACSGGDKPPKNADPAPTPSPESGQCESLALAYNPRNGYEASPFVVGEIAEAELGCEVTYRKTTTRQAWRLVARGQVDAYLDAYGNDDLREKFAGSKKSVTVVGPNGVHGGVAFVIPAFMYELGLKTSRDLADVARIGWGTTPPVVTTLPELLPLASAVVAFTELDYQVRDYSAVEPTATMGDLLLASSADDSRQLPNVYLVEGPRGLVTPGQGRQVIDVPESAGSECAPELAATLCEVTDFDYDKIVNTEFAQSDNPAYNLIYNYRLGREPADDIMQLVALSGYRVNAADAASWVNTHEEVWRQWLT